MNYHLKKHATKTKLRNKVNKMVIKDPKHDAALPRGSVVVVVTSGVGLTEFEYQGSVRRDISLSGNIN